MEVKSIIVQGIEDVEIVKETIDENNLRPYEAFIETYYTHISPGTELSRVFGIKVGATYPFRVGYCAVGKILAKGSELTNIEVGDFVLFSGKHSSYHIFDYRNSDGGILYKLDPRLPLDQAVCLVMCWIAMNGILCVDVKVTDTVAIFGLGILGQILSILYKEAGVKVIGVDPIANRSKHLNLDHLLDEPKTATEKIMAITKGIGVDIAVDASGTSPGVISAVEVARRYGEVVLLGSPRAPYETDITPTLNAIHMKNLTVKGALNRLFPYDVKEGSRFNIKESLDYLTGLMLKGKIDTTKIVSHVIRAEDAMEAYRGLMYDKNNYIGVIIDWKKE